jgi:hypothetical protein
MDAHAAAAQPREDKWLEFLALEPRLRAELHRAAVAAKAPRNDLRRVEARATYLWLLAAALFAWFAS